MAVRKSRIKRMLPRSLGCSAGKVMGKVIVIKADVIFANHIDFVAFVIRL
jgi:hypothetical protein